MAMLADVAAYLVANGIGAIGSTIVVAEIPKTPDLCVMLFEYAGRPPELLLDGAGDVNPGLQVRVRSARNKYLDGLAKAEAIQALLNGLANVTLSGTEYGLFQAMGSPAYEHSPEEKDDRPMWVQNYIVTKEP